MMKKYISVFGFLGRISFYKILACFVLLSVSQLSYYYISLKNNLQLYSQNGKLPILEETFTAFYAITFFICLFLVCRFIISPQNHSEKTAYTVKRLRITEKKFFYIQTVYNALIIFILFALQAVLLFVMCKYYISTVPDRFISEQSLFLAFYRVDFLHSILPLEDTFLSVRNAFIIVGLAFASASFSFKGRHGKFGYSIIVFFIILCMMFICSIGDISNNITLHLAAFIVTVRALMTVHGDKEEEDEEIN